MATRPCSLLSLAAQLAALQPAVAAHKAACAEITGTRRARNAGRPRHIDVGCQIRERIVALIDKQGFARISQIADALAMSPGRISHHVSVLMAEKKLRRRGSSHDGYEIKRGHHA